MYQRVPGNGHHAHHGGRKLVIAALALMGLLAVLLVGVSITLIVYNTSPVAPINSTHENSTDPDPPTINRAPPAASKKCEAYMGVVAPVTQKKGPCPLGTADVACNSSACPSNFGGVSCSRSSTWTITESVAPLDGFALSPPDPMEGALVVANPSVTIAVTKSSAGLASLAGALTLSLTNAGSGDASIASILLVLDQVTANGTIAYADDGKKHTTRAIIGLENAALTGGCNTPSVAQICLGGQQCNVSVPFQSGFIADMATGGTVLSLASLIVPKGTHCNAPVVKNLEFFFPLSLALYQEMLATSDGTFQVSALITYDRGCASGSACGISLGCNLVVNAVKTTFVRSAPIPVPALSACSARCGCLTKIESSARVTNITGGDCLASADVLGSLPSTMRTETSVCASTTFTYAGSVACDTRNEYCLATGVSGTGSTFGLTYGVETTVQGPPSECYDPVTGAPLIHTSPALLSFSRPLECTRVSTPGPCVYQCPAYTPIVDSTCDITTSPACTQPGQRTCTAPIPAHGDATTCLPYVENTTMACAPACTLSLLSVDVTPSTNGASISWAVAPPSEYADGSCTIRIILADGSGADVLVFTDQAFEGTRLTGASLSSATDYSVEVSCTAEQCGSECTPVARTQAFSTLDCLSTCSIDSVTDGPIGSTGSSMNISIGLSPAVVAPDFLNCFVQYCLSESPATCTGPMIGGLAEIHLHDLLPSNTYFYRVHCEVYPTGCPMVSCSDGEVHAFNTPCVFHGYNLVIRDTSVTLYWSVSAYDQATSYISCSSTAPPSTASVNTSASPSMGATLTGLSPTTAYTAETVCTYHSWRNPSEPTTCQASAPFTTACPYGVGCTVTQNVPSAVTTNSFNVAGSIAAPMESTGGTCQAILYNGVSAVDSRTLPSSGAYSISWTGLQSYTSYTSTVSCTYDQPGDCPDVTCSASRTQRTRPVCPAFSCDTTTNPPAVTSSSISTIVSSSTPSGYYNAGCEGYLYTTSSMEYLSTAVADASSTITWTGLSASTSYSYYVSCYYNDDTGLCGRSCDSPWTTGVQTSAPACTTQPSCGGLFVSDVTPSSIRVTWSSVAGQSCHVTINDGYAIPTSSGATIALPSDLVAGSSNRVDLYCSVCGTACGSSTTFTAVSYCSLMNIRDVSVSNSGSNVMTFTWRTSVPSSTQVYVNNALALNLPLPLVTEHSASSSAFADSTTYSYYVASTDAGGNTCRSADSSFTTGSALCYPCLIQATGGVSCMSMSACTNGGNTVYRLTPCTACSSAATIETSVCIRSGDVIGSNIGACLESTNAIPCACLQDGGAPYCAYSVNPFLFDRCYYKTNYAPIYAECPDRCSAYTTSTENDPIPVECTCP